MIYASERLPDAEVVGALAATMPWLAGGTAVVPARLDAVGVTAVEGLVPASAGKALTLGAGAGAAAHKAVSVSAYNS